jgi:hypothetical protein
MLKNYKQFEIIFKILKADKPVFLLPSLGGCLNQILDPFHLKKAACQPVETIVNYKIYFTSFKLALQGVNTCNLLAKEKYQMKHKQKLRFSFFGL